MQSTIDYLSSYYKNNFIDSDFANKVRQEAFQRFLERGMPSRKDESWRYANIPGWYKNHLKPPSIMMILICNLIICGLSLI